ncbi:MAG: Aminotran 1 2 protein [Acidobacteriota bacterium]|nr:Aminotran 1 2 protein [Acidobacteriota bacterium]
MKIKKLLMEDWLADYQSVEYNLAESGFVDFSLGAFLSFCKENPSNLEKISLMNPDTHGSIGLRREIVRCYLSAEVENVLVTAGVTEALFTFFNTVLEPGDEVIVEFPEFQTLYELPAALGCEIKFLTLSKENGFLPEAGKIRDLITPRTKLIIINNPHNPSGSLLDVEMIREIGKIARENDCYLLFDEHYKFLPLVEGTEQLTSGFDICRPFHNKIAAVGSITKCFGLNGLRVGWLLAEPQIIEECREFKHYLTHVTPPLCDYLAETALRNKEKLIRFVKDNILKNLGLLNDFMKAHEHKFEYIEPRGGLVCFPKLKDQEDASLFCRDLLIKHNVSLLPGETFGMKQYFRLNFGVQASKFAKALQAMDEP